jgi:hypothetical protein
MSPKLVFVSAEIAQGTAQNFSIFYPEFCLPERLTSVGE